ncbi:MobA/MobL family protein [Siphonobacter sp. BAB-5385]|uniref:MobA/MobL family protein n=1 Tax=Siphonobacter sp. BAB-5385 TaxID=1864822 RepID=UPI0015953E8A|nr:MobA/MobL family protein [Siphonobacter sp. BAB-5385]
MACAAYRAGEKVKDDRYEKTHDFTQKHNVLHTEIITPDGAPEWMRDREKLWNGVEAGEKRKDAQLAKEALLVLPRNLTIEEQRNVVRGFIRENVTSRGLVADYAIHSPEASDGQRNPHAHVMFTLRPVDGEGFGKKLTGYKNGGLDGVEFLQDMRLSYERLLNEASEKARLEIRFELVHERERLPERRKTISAKIEQPDRNTPVQIWHIEKRGESTTIGPARRRAEHLYQAGMAQQSYHLFSQLSYHASRVVDQVRDDLAHKYYEVMYGPEHAYPENATDHFKPWEHER